MGSNPTLKKKRRGMANWLERLSRVTGGPLLLIVPDIGRLPFKGRCLTLFLRAGIAASGSKKDPLLITRTDRIKSLKGI